MSDDTLNSTAKGQLKSFLERYERLAREKAEADQAMREVLAEVKGAGFDTAIFKDVVKARSQDAALRAERGAIFTLYLEAAR